MARRRPVTLALTEERCPLAYLFVKEREGADGKLKKSCAGEVTDMFLTLIEAGLAAPCNLQQVGRELQRIGKILEEKCLTENW